jgi:hypothetical protein
MTPWNQMDPATFSPRPKATQTALVLSTDSGQAVSPAADPLGTLDMLSLLADQDDRSDPQ